MDKNGSLFILSYHTIVQIKVFSQFSVVLEHFNNLITKNQRKRITEVIPELISFTQEKKILETYRVMKNNSEGRYNLTDKNFLIFDIDLEELFGNISEYPTEKLDYPYFNVYKPYLMGMEFFFPQYNKDRTPIEIIFEWNFWNEEIIDESYNSLVSFNTYPRFSDVFTTNQRLVFDHQKVSQFLYELEKSPPSIDEIQKLFTSLQCLSKEDFNQYYARAWFKTPTNRIQKVLSIVDQLKPESTFYQYINGKIELEKVAFKNKSEIREGKKHFKALKGKEFFNGAEIPNLLLLSLRSRKNEHKLISKYISRLHKDPLTPKKWIQLGYCFLYGIIDEELAYRCFQIAFNLDPEKIPSSVCADIAGYFSLRKEHRFACHWTVEALKRNPYNIFYWLNLCMALQSFYALNQSEELKTLFLKTTEFFLKRTPEFPLFYTHFLTIFDLLGLSPRTEDILKQVQTLRREDDILDSLLTLADYVMEERENIGLEAFVNKFIDNARALDWHKFSNDWKDPVESFMNDSIEEIKIAHLIKRAIPLYENDPQIKIGNWRPDELLHKITQVPDYSLLIAEYSSQELLVKSLVNSGVIDRDLENQSISVKPHVSIGMFHTSDEDFLLVIGGKLENEEFSLLYGQSRQNADNIKIVRCSTNNVEFLQGQIGQVGADTIIDVMRTFEEGMNLIKNEEVEKAKKYFHRITKAYPQFPILKVMALQIFWRLTYYDGCFHLCKALMREKPLTTDLRKLLEKTAEEISTLFPPDLDFHKMHAIMYLIYSILEEKENVKIYAKLFDLHKLPLKWREYLNTLK